MTLDQIRIELKDNLGDIHSVISFQTWDKEQRG
jgi:hypothetical protein